jgi:hypothetical protein
MLYLDIMQVSSGPQPSGRSHIARVIAASTPDMKDGVAYLSPFLAQNLDLQLHLEAFLSAEALTESSSSKEHAADDRLDSHSRASVSGCTDLGEGPSLRPLSAQKVRITPLDARAHQEGFGSVLQPGQTTKYQWKVTDLRFLVFVLSVGNRMCQTGAMLSRI